MLEKNHNPKISKIESKIPSISRLATNSALTSVENKILILVILSEKKDYNAKILDIEKKVADHDLDKYM